MFMPRHLSQSVDAIARQSLGKEWALYASLLEHWAEIVGNDYARITTPVKMTFPHQPNEARRKNGTLTVRLPKGLAMEFTFKTELMRQRINSYFGYEAIGKIALDPVFGVPTKPETIAAPDEAKLAVVEESVKSLESDELRDALRSFGTILR